MLFLLHEIKLLSHHTELLLSSGYQLRLVSQGSPETSDLFGGDRLGWTLNCNTAFAEYSSPCAQALQENISYSRF